MAVIEAVIRWIPGVSRQRGKRRRRSRSIPDGRDPRIPAVHAPARVPRHGRVPEVLVGGDHAKVERWRREQALARTRRAQARSSRKGRTP